jgi:hypothetical protein
MVKEDPMFVGRVVMPIPVPQAWNVGMIDDSAPLKLDEYRPPQVTVHLYPPGDDFGSEAYGERVLAADSPDDYAIIVEDAADLLAAVDAFLARAR